MKDLVVTVELAGPAACPRCRQRHYCVDNFDQLCDRCSQVLLAEHPNHPSISGIKEAYRLQREKWMLNDRSTQECTHGED